MSLLDVLITQVLSRIESDISFLANHGIVSPLDCETVMSVCSRAGLQDSSTNNPGKHAELERALSVIISRGNSPISETNNLGSGAADAFHKPLLSIQPKLDPSQHTASQRKGPNPAYVPCTPPDTPPFAPMRMPEPFHFPSSDFKLRKSWVATEPKGIPFKAKWDFNAKYGNLDVRIDVDRRGEASSLLSFHRGDIIHIVAQDNCNWWLGSLNGKQGLVSPNFVEPIPVRQPCQKHKAAASASPNLRF